MSRFSVQRPYLDPVTSHGEDFGTERRAGASDARAERLRKCRVWVLAFRRLVENATPAPASVWRLLRYPVHNYGVCNFTSCTFLVHDAHPIYVCVHTGAVHICTPNCDRMQYLQDYNVMKCAVSGREYKSDFEDDNIHTRAAKRSHTSAPTDGDSLYAEATVRSWQRQETDGLFQEQCRRVRQSQQFFPDFPIPECTLADDLDHVEEADEDESPELSPEPTPRRRPKPRVRTSSPSTAIVRRRTVSRVAKASLVTNKGTRGLVSSVWKSVLLEFYPTPEMRKAINDAYLLSVESALQGRHDIPLFLPAPELNTLVNARVAQNMTRFVFAWLFRYMWFLWVAIISTERYQRNQFLYQTQQHAIAVVRYLETGYQQNSRQIVPRVSWLGENAVDIKVRSRNTMHRTHTVLRNITRSVKLFMNYCSDVCESHWTKLPLLSRPQDEFFT